MTDRNPLSDLSWYIRNQAPNIEARGQMRQSRRIEGQFSYSSELKAYRAIMCYIEQGLADQKIKIIPIINAIVQFQRQQGRTDYHFCLFSFHSNDTQLKHHGHSYEIVCNANSNNLAHLLCELSGDKPAGQAPVIHQLFPVPALYSRIRRVTQEDLLLFICRNRSVKFDARLKELYTSKIQRHSIWIFIEEGQLSIEMGKIIPEFQEMEESNNELPEG